MSEIADKIGSRYDDIVSYFKRNPFGSIMPDLTVLSLLPPVDRCLILERVAKVGRLNVLVFVDKLSMAYLKVGWRDLADLFLTTCWQRGIIRDDHFAILSDKIATLHVHGTSQCYKDALDKLPRYEQVGDEFCLLIRELCEFYRGDDVLAGVDALSPISMRKLAEFKDERLDFIHGLRGDGYGESGSL